MQIFCVNDGQSALGPQLIVAFVEKPDGQNALEPQMLPAAGWQE